MTYSTRSRSASSAAAPATPSRTKRSTPSTPVADASPSKKPRASRPKAVPATPNPAPSIAQGALLDSADLVADEEHIIVRPKLSFNYEDAKKHLISVDPRFQTLMDALPCKPFIEETDLNPFRALCSSILGQQISWLAARSITHKFIRLVAFPELPEKPEPTGMTPHFPTPRQVAAADMATLRAAGLSQRKAEYVQDLAARFADGRLSAAKLVEMSDEEVMTALTEVRGIGKWTVEMFMIFTLRRPNVLPCGDLGVQKGLVRWLTQVNPSVQSKKLPQEPAPLKSRKNISLDSEKDAASNQAEAPVQPQGMKNGQGTPPPPQTDGGSSEKADYFQVPSTPSSSTPKQASKTDNSTPNGKATDTVGVPLMTPRTEKTAQLPPFPESKTLTRESLKGRLNKKVKGNIYLTPHEMEELTVSWAPYRSIGVWYLWSIADGDATL